MTRSSRLTALLMVGALTALGCAEAAPADFGAREPSPLNNAAGPGTGVGQSGAQDFGRFRSIVESGQIPAPNTLDAVGFFNEHKFELPAAECGENVCMHTKFGIWGNLITGANCTLTMLGFNTALDPKTYQRPPLNMALAIDTSGSMAGPPLEAVRAGLLKMVETLNQKDSITLVTYSDVASVVLTSDPSTDPDRRLLREALLSLQAQGGTNIYSGLRLALDEVARQQGNDRQNRVLFLSDGQATSGLTSRERIVRLGEAYAADGIGITTIGVGENFDIELMERLSETGAGNFYFLEDADAVEEVFVEEVNTFMVPLAEEVKITFQAAEAYRFRATYGTRIWEADGDGAEIYIPGLFMASRTSVEDIGPGGGRRGGGGAILFEVMPSTNPQVLADAKPGHAIGTVTMEYRVPGTDRIVTQSSTVTSPIQAGDLSADGDFSDIQVEKAFVTLNAFVGFRMALDRFSTGAPGEAVSILEPLADNIEEWTERTPDPDLQEDVRLMRQLLTSMRREGARPDPIDFVPPEPWPRGD
jgi:Ca-activated chloride channel family protein